MAATPSRPKLLVIVGPTASGKSELALNIAKKYNGEIIAADSRTVYRDMNIGTAKPSLDDQKALLHWGLDLVNPGQRFTAADFKQYAEAKIVDIQKRGKLPLLVGGTGLYIDSVLFDFGFLADFDPKLRKELEQLSVQDLQKIIKQRGYTMPTNYQNKRHLIRVIETKSQKGTKKSLVSKQTLIIGLLPSDELLKKAINDRVEHIFQKGLVKETKRLLKIYGQNSISNSAGIAYRTCLELIEHRLDETEAKAIIKTKEWQYARRQRTWFKRDPHIKWFNDVQQAYEAIKKQL